jgi:acyl transferase domain-containing protein/pimeloyl-ACP methyl ester carboxylesterase/aryl carrier-like protein
VTNAASTDKDRDKLRRALVALKTLRARYEALERKQSEPIAVVGMACRSPGADDIQEYWDLLAEGRDASSEIPENRWPSDKFYDPDPNKPGKMHVKRGSFLSKRVENFDCEFFGISPREAKTLSVEQRLLLEVAWEALEHSGHAPGSLIGSSTGMFLGIGLSDLVQIAAGVISAEDIDPYCGVGQTASVAAGRLAFTLGLRGPTLAVDTACSSSLVAIDLAVRSLRAGECRMALAAGAAIILSPYTQIFLDKLKALSADGRCKTFDSSADGFGRGEGCGVVVLKRLSDAEADGDRILALIRGSSVNHDGRSAGLTVPSGPSQEAVMQKALENAAVKPDDIDYLEAHGTGTQLGDPIEVRSVSNVYGKERNPARPLAMGSVKTNIGHLEAASGMASVIKVILAMGKKQIPAHLHLKRLNPHIQLDERRIQIPRQRQAWTPAEGRPRTAAVSAFSICGTNAHLILEEFSPRPRESTADRKLHIFTSSNKTAETLEALVERHRRHLETTADPFADVCFTANRGRTHFSHRIAVVAADAKEAARLLREQAFRGQAPAHPIHVAFVFPDRLDRAPSFDDEPRFLQVALEIDAAADAVGARQHPDFENLRTQMALSALWQGLGVLPYAVYGEGVGEIAAAWTAGMLTVEDALRALLGETVTVTRARRSFIASSSGKTCLELAADYFTKPRTPMAVEAKATLEKLRCEGIVEIAAAGATGDARGLLDSLARLYVKGVNIDWEAFDAGRGRQIVTLPSTPTRPQRLWIDDGLLSEAIERRTAKESGRDDKASTYRLDWRREPPPNPDRGRAREGGALIVITSGQKGRELSRALALHAPVIELDGVSSDEFARARSRAIAEHGRVAHVLHLSSLDGLDATASGEAVQTQIVSWCQEITTLCKNWTADGSSLVIITRGAQAAKGRVTAPAAASLWGLGRTLTAEHSETGTRLVDLDPDISASASDLLAELAESAPEFQVAYRNRERHVLRMVPSPKILNDTATIAADGMYLVTGAFGGIGLHVARALVKRGAKHLCLVGRTGATSSEAQAMVRELEQSGIRVLPIAADVAKVADIDRLLASIAETKTPLRGIVHSAGVLEGGLVIEQTAQSYAKEFSPKIAGTWNLLKATETQPGLDWIVLFSSIASFLPSPGLGNYAAANAFVDAMAETHSAGPSRLVLNWGPWRDTGMAAGKNAFTDRLAARGMLALEPPRAANLFGLLIGEGGQRAIVSVDWTAYVPKQPPTMLPFFSAMQVAAPVPAPVVAIEKATARVPLAHRLADAPAELRAGILLVYLQELGSRVSGRSPDDISVTQNLLDIGFDSLMAMDMLAQLKKDLPFAIDPRDFYARPTVAGIAAFLADRFNGAAANAAPEPVAAEASAPLPVLKAPLVTPRVDAAERRERRVAGVIGGNLTLSVCEWGAEPAPTTVILHGLEDQAMAWEPVAQALARAGQRVIAPDLRGHGLSDHVGPDGEYHLVDMVRDIDRVLAGVKGPMTLVGHSLGAAVAGLLALARKGRFASLVLVEPPVVSKRSVLEGITAYLDHKGGPAAHVPFASIDEAVDRMLRSTPSLDRDRARMLCTRLLEPATDGRLRWRWDARLRTSAGLQLSDAFAESLNWSAISVPTLLVVGKDSDSRSAAPDGLKPVVLPGGHNLHHDCASELARLILDMSSPAQPSPYEGEGKGGGEVGHEA